MKIIIAIIEALTITIETIIIAPLINFTKGWAIGHLIKWIFGATFISGLAMLGVTISPESMPVFCGVLAVIGSFFENTTINKKKGN